MLASALAEALEAAQPLSFREFIKKVKPKYRFFRHCERLIDVLQRVADGELKRVMVFMPPRHGKSELVSRLFAAYYLYRHPERWVAITSYGADLAYTLSRAARSNFQAAGGNIRDDSAAVKHWETAAGGGLWACGVGGPATGKGWHLGIVDDPLKNAEAAQSETIREKHKEWYDSTFYSREEPDEFDNPDGALVVVQTRWHEDDLSGWLLSQETAEDGEPEHWHIVNYSALKDPETELQFPPTCTVEPDCRARGEALCPERRPVEKLERMRRRLAPYIWGALYQQNPLPEGSGLFNRGMFRYFRMEPDSYVLKHGERLQRIPKTSCFVVQTVDLAASERDQADFTVVSTWAVTPARDLLLLSVKRERLEGPGVKTLIRQEFRHRQPVFIGIERNGLGVTLVQDLLAEGLPLRGVWQHRDKITRAWTASARYESGCVYHLENAEWLGAWEAELLGFPNSAKKDQVDTASLAAQLVNTAAGIFAADFSHAFHVAEGVEFDARRPLVCGWAFEPCFAWVVGQLDATTPSTPGSGQFRVLAALTGEQSGGLYQFAQTVHRSIKSTGCEPEQLQLHHAALPGYCGFGGKGAQAAPYADAWLTLNAGIETTTGYRGSGTPVSHQRPGFGWLLTAGEENRSRREEVIRTRLTSLVQGEPALLIDATAAPVIEALSGAYQYRQNATGEYLGEPLENDHSAVVEALGCALSILPRTAPQDEERDELNAWGPVGTASGAGRRR